MPDWLLKFVHRSSIIVHRISTIEYRSPVRLILFWPFTDRAMADDDFLNLFDLFVKWPLRLGKEGPFIVRFLEEIGARTVVDAGAGSGRHAAYLAGKGYEVTATDAAPCMIEETARHAREEGVSIGTALCDFADLPEHVRPPVDAVICLGNSLSMCADRASVSRSIEAFASILHPGSLLLLHVLNYEGLRKMDKRVSRPTRLPDGDLVVKVFDLEPEATRVNFIRMTESKPGAWKSAHRWAPLLPLSLGDLGPLLEAKGFAAPQAFGSADGSPYDPDLSYDLFLKTTRG